MPKAKTIQRGFFGGIISPEMFGHVDKVQFQNGCARLENFIAYPQGAARNRPGFGFVRKTKHGSSKKCNVIPFRYSVDQTFAIEVGEGYFRFHTGGQTLLFNTPTPAPSAYVASVNISAIAQNEIAGWDFTCTAHGLVAGDLVEIGRGSTTTVPTGYAEGVDYYVVETASTRDLNVFINDGGDYQADTTVAHGLAVNEAVSFTNGGGLLPAGIITGAVYYVTQVDSATQFNFSDTPGGTNIAFVAAGTATMKLHRLDQSDPDKLRLTTRPGGAAITTNTSLPGNFPRLHRSYKAGDLADFGGDIYQCLEDQPIDVPPNALKGYWQQMTDGRPYEIGNFYLESEVFDLDVDQVGDVVTITHPSHPAMELRRLSATTWAFNSVKTGSAVTPPSSVAVTATVGQTFDMTAEVNAVGATPVYIQLDTNIPNTNSIGFVEGAYVKIAGVGDAAVDGEFIITDDALAAQRFEVARVKDETDVLLSSEATTVGAGSHPGSVRLLSSLSQDDTQSYVVTSLDTKGVESVPSSTVTVTNNLFGQGAFNTVTWALVPNASHYRVYRQERGVMSLVTQVEQNVSSYKDDGDISPDSGRNPPTKDFTIEGGEAPVSFATTITDSYVVWGRNPLKNGDKIVFATTDTLPTGITAGTTYYVVQWSVNRFRISADPSSAVFVGFSGSPAGVNTVKFGAQPRAVAHFEQRRLFASSQDFPQRVWGSRSGSEIDMSYTIPPKDDDRIQVDLNSVSIIRHMVAADHLLLFTDDTEYRVTPINTDALTPDSFTARKQTFNGSSKVTPLYTGDGLLFCAARGGHVLEMGFQASTQGFVSGDVSLRAAHLFDDYQVVGWGYARAPKPLAWVASTSGSLLGFTYLPREGIGAWHEHKTAGTIEAVCVIPDGTEDHAYVVVKRTINSVDTRHIERMNILKVDQIGDAFHVDCGSTYSGAASTVIRNLTHLDGEAVVGLADGVEFAGTVVAQPNQGAVFASAGATVTVTAHGFVAGEAVTIHDTIAGSPLPTELIDGETYYVSSTNLNVNDFELEHAPGEGSISYAAGAWDGEVKGSGRLTLATAASKVQVGLAYTSILQTLPMSATMEAFGLGRTKTPTKAWVRFYESGTFRAGASETVYEEFTVTGLQTAVERRHIPTGWNEEGQVMIIQNRPLPLTVVSLVFDVEFGG